MSATRVLLIGRKTMCLEGLSAILAASPEIEVVGRSADWKEGVARAATRAHSSGHSGAPDGHASMAPASSASPGAARMGLTKRSRLTATIRAE